MVADKIAAPPVAAVPIWFHGGMLGFGGDALTIKLVKTILLLTASVLVSQIA